ncbi:nitric oxide reductase D protein [Limibaculum sp. FT325]|uniref:nitric oxide reductase activation protein NorD n=1 Tax=Thermohalobaculum sediminis TaxID=2939436 RepID=UPI0020C0F5CD|nr:nitric oxide reductase D protein [Limibaculum sediminis]MCL5778389.1 nitric oxide reductase D protein [Limibaculum sediminis]
MTGIDFEPWEPEETVGKLWHAFASRLDAPEAHEGAATDLSEIGGRLAVFFRGLGGAHAVEIVPVRAEASSHRLSWRRKLGTPREYVARASFDGAALRLPERIAAFPAREANAALYFWLTAAAAHAPAPVTDPDPLRADLLALRAIHAMTRATLAACPGLAGLHADLARACLAQRRDRVLPRWEAAVEQAIRALLAEAASAGPATLAPTRAPATSPRGPGSSPGPRWTAPAEGGPGSEAGSAAPDTTAAAILAAIRADSPDLAPFRAPMGYRPFEPVPLWPALRATAPSEASAEAGETPDGAPQDGKEGTHRARRRKSDQAERRDSLILHKFEAILSWTEFLNLNRRVDDDDPDSAKKALDDQDEITLGQVSKAPATRLKLHLDLAPEDVDRERLSGNHLYPEWDARSGTYLPAHARVLASPAEAPADGATPLADPQAARRIRAVRRQFEALRPRRIPLPGQPDGEDLDIEAVVRSAADIRATGEGTDRIWRATRPQARDLAVSILLDVSRSTESAVTGRAVIDIEREALAALAWGLEACGDDFAIHAFSSLKRDRVYVLGCKEFDEPMSAKVEARIAGLRPGFYTRLGAAIRHVSADLARQARARRLLLVITDGKPNDLDHYEGRHGIEDSRMAIREARRAGHAVHGVLVDAKGKSWFPRMFGQGGFSIVPHPDRLGAALPEIYRHLVGA